jgi:hypothetical protein
MYFIFCVNQTGSRRHASSLSTAHLTFIILYQPDDDPLVGLKNVSFIKYLNQ